MSNSMIPYTHWAYFPDEATARACAEDLQDYVTRIKQVESSTADTGLCSYGEVPSTGAGCVKLAGHTDDHDVRPGTTNEWLLLAGRDVHIDGMIERHNEVQAIVERHGGLYDYGESTWDTSLGQAVADPMLTGEWDTTKNN